MDFDLGSLRKQYKAIMDSRTMAKPQYEAAGSASTLRNPTRMLSEAQATPIAAKKERPATALSASVSADSFGPDRSSGFSSNVNRVGNRLNTGGGYIESNDSAGLARVEQGLRGIQSKDGQSYVSNNFMTMPAYKTPEWLERARSLRAEREANRQPNPAAAALMAPEAPKMVKWDSRTGSFSDLGNAKRQNRFNLAMYGQQMQAYNNAVDAQAALTRQDMANRNALQQTQMNNVNALERERLQQEGMAPSRLSEINYRNFLMEDAAKDNVRADNSARAAAFKENREDVDTLLDRAVGAGPDGKIDPAKRQAFYTQTSNFLRENGMEPGAATPEQWRQAIAAMGPAMQITDNVNAVRAEISGGAGIREAGVINPNNLRRRGIGFGDYLMSPTISTGDYLRSFPLSGAAEQLVEDDQGNVLGPMTRVAADPAGGMNSRSVGFIKEKNK